MLTFREINIELFDDGDPDNLQVVKMTVKTNKGSVDYGHQDRGTCVARLVAKFIEDLKPVVTDTLISRLPDQ